MSLLIYNNCAVFDAIAVNYLKVFGVEYDVHLFNDLRNPLSCRGLGNRELSGPIPNDISSFTQLGLLYVIFDAVYGFMLFILACRCHPF